MIIKDFRDDECEISEEEVLNILKGIYDGTACNGCYMAGSLCYSHKVDNHPKGEKDFLFTFHVDESHPPEIQYWISKLYLQNKSEDACYWKQANEIVNNFEKEKM
jgi:hypothetical protein